MLKLSLDTEISKLLIGLITIGMLLSACRMTISAKLFQTARSAYQERECRAALVGFTKNRVAPF
jgi:hypothetical protein